MPKKPLHAPPKCKICDSQQGPWTEEDAYPKWLRKRIVDWLRTLPDGTLDPGWEQGSRVLLKPVCQPCQRRLNELFEIPTHDLLKTMMDGSALKLTARQLILVAGWVAKTALVLRLADKDTEPYAAEVIRGYLGHRLEHATPPANTTMRIGYLSDSLHDPGDGFLPPGWPDVLDPHLGFFGLLVVPGFACEMIVGPAPVIQSFIDATKDDDRFVLVWPPPITGALWPPRDLLGVRDLEPFREAWDRTGKWTGNFPELNVTEYRVRRR